MEGKRELAFPESVIDLLAGTHGSAAGRLSTESAKANPPRHQAGHWAARANRLPPADFEAAAAEVEKLTDEKPTDQDIATHLLYPRVFADFVAARTEVFGY